MILYIKIELIKPLTRTGAAILRVHLIVHLRLHLILTVYSVYSTMLYTLLYVYMLYTLLHVYMLNTLLSVYILYTLLCVYILYIHTIYTTVRHRIPFPFLEWRSCELLRCYFSRSPRLITSSLLAIIGSVVIIN